MCRRNWKLNPRPHAPTLPQLLRPLSQQPRALPKKTPAGGRAGNLQEVRFCVFLIIDRSIQGYRGVWVGRVRYEFRGAAAQELEDHLRLFDPECPARRCSSWTSFCSLNQGLFFWRDCRVCAHSEKYLLSIVPSGTFPDYFHARPSSQTWVRNLCLPGLTGDG